jgi:hypothetical protein
MLRISSSSNKYHTAKLPSYSTRQKGKSLFFEPFIQPKVTINQASDIYEQEADAVAEKVMRMPAPRTAETFFPPKSTITSIKRKCTACEEEEKLQRTEDEEEKNAIQLSPLKDFYVQRKCAACEEEEKIHRKETSIFSSPTITPAVEQTLQSPGEALDRDTRSFMEDRFRYGFGKVQIHNDSFAHQSCADINALAYNYENHVVFGAGRYQTTAESSKHLLAHELAHVIQQAPFAFHLIRNEKRNVISRFSDPSHHIIEEAALAGGGFTKEQREKIERGSMQRDYSQIGTIGNTVLLCQPDDFGGYKTYEHFDNFMWDNVQSRWRTRGASALKVEGEPVDIGKTPIDYIKSELKAVANLGLGAHDRGLEHLGNAFHTIEDFFSHSNFIELINKDFRFGKTLLTGNFDKVDQAVSMRHAFGSVSVPETEKYYGEQADVAAAESPALSHSRISHDDPSANNYGPAMQLAALVIQDLSRDIISLMSKPKQNHQQLMIELVIPKVIRYLRPPSDNDKWWEQLQKNDKGKIDARLSEAKRQTTVTHNHCIVSPARNLEASKDSNMHIVLGVAIPITSSGAYFQAGYGTVTLFESGTNIENKKGPSFGFVGAQITFPID